MAAAANAHDVDRHLAAYWRDPALVFVFDGAAIRGFDALREAQRRWWQDGRATGTYAYVGEPVWQALGERLGTTTHCIAARKPLPGGGCGERLLTFTAVWRRLDAGWRIVHAHESFATSGRP